MLKSVGIKPLLQGFALGMHYHSYLIFNSLFYLVKSEISSFLLQETAVGYNHK
jgi:hypothetical protein